jgi:tetratricopeptide (TPR) repeat protein
LLESSDCQRQDTKKKILLVIGATIVLAIVVTIVWISRNFTIPLLLVSAKVHNKRGLYYLGISEIETLIKEFAKAIRINPNYVEAVRNRGIAFLNLEHADLERAFDRINKAIQSNPIHYEICVDRANRYQHRSDGVYASA